MDFERVMADSKIWLTFIILAEICWNDNSGQMYNLPTRKYHKFLLKVGTDEQAHQRGLHVKENGDSQFTNKK